MHTQSGELDKSLQQPSPVETDQKPLAVACEIANWISLLPVFLLSLSLSLFSLTVHLCILVWNSIIDFRIVNSRMLIDAIIISEVLRHLWPQALPRGCANYPGPPPPASIGPLVSFTKERAVTVGSGLARELNQNPGSYRGWSSQYKIQTSLVLCSRAIAGSTGWRGEREREKSEWDVFPLAQLLKAAPWFGSIGALFSWTRKPVSVCQLRWRYGPAKETVSNLSRPSQK